SFTSKFHETISHGIIRGVEPTGPNSIITDKIKVVTAPSSNVCVVLTIHSKAHTGSALGAGNGIAAPYVEGSTLGQGCGNASNTGLPGTTGQITLSFPITSTVVIPGRAVTIEKVITINAQNQSTVQTLKGSFTLREVRLRLIVQNDETTRGNVRSPFVI